ncbi:MAG: InlB B-repeat-containing protein [Bacteroidales bacterium]|nr:InlB B-repeat-containing protein [Bacteroidales bacterium]
MAMSIRKYIYASLALICLMCSCDPWLVPPVKITYEEDANGHKYVDLGLSVKWAAYDIGANSATELGDFFAWGETQPKKDYSWDTYKFAVTYKSPESATRSFDNGYGKEYELTKYNLDPNSEYYDGKNTLDLIDDAAHMAWGGNWRMPTKAECEELLEKCEWTRTEYLGVYGYDVKGPNGNRMFLPHYKEVSDMLSDRWFYRWSSNCLNNNDTYYNPEEFAYTMSESGFGEAHRSFGLFVRAVYDKSLPKYSVLTFDANGGEGLMHPQQFNKGVSQSINAVRFTHESLNFAGWNTAPDGSGTSYTDKQSITLTQDITLYAQWALANGEENGYGYVDLGLPRGTKWAIYNVGTTSPEGYGDYFAWGETSPKDNYDWSTYKYCKGSENTKTKYYIQNDLGRGGRKNHPRFYRRCRPRELGRQMAHADIHRNRRVDRSLFLGMDYAKRSKWLFGNKQEKRQQAIFACGRLSQWYFCQLCRFRGILLVELARSELSERRSLLVLLFERRGLWLLRSPLRFHGSRCVLR